MEDKKDEELELDKMKKLEKLQSAFNYSIFPKKEEPSIFDSEKALPQEVPTKEEKILKIEEPINEEKPNEESNIPKEESNTEENIDVSMETPIYEDNSVNEKELKKLDNNISKMPKYDGYKERLIRYSLFAIISLVFLLISTLGYYHVKREKTSLVENSKINYTVCLKENNYYEEKCIGEENEYLSSLTNKIRIDYIYNAVYQKKDKKKYKYYIKSRILFKTGDKKEIELFKKEDLITEKQKNTLTGKIVTIIESIEIPFQNYNGYAQAYKIENPMVSMSNLEVSLVLKDGKIERELSTTIIPLTKVTYNITKKEISNRITKYSMPFNNLLISIFVICIALGLFFTIITLKKLGHFLWQTKTKKTSFQKQLSKILKKYDKYIVTLENQSTIVNNKEEYIVKSFLELLDVSNTIKEPILYYKVNDIKSEFYVQDTTKSYKYTMKESDFEEE